MGRSRCHSGDGSNLPPHCARHLFGGIYLHFVTWYPWLLLRIRSYHQPTPSKSSLGRHVNDGVQGDVQRIVNSCCQDTPNVRKDEPISRKHEVSASPLELCPDPQDFRQVHSDAAFGFLLPHRDAAIRACRFLEDGPDFRTATLAKHKLTSGTVPPWRL